MNNEGDRKDSDELEIAQELPAEGSAQPRRPEDRQRTSHSEGGRSGGLGLALELIYSVLLQPVPTFRTLATRPPVAVAIGLFIGMILLNGILAVFIYGSRIPKMLAPVAPGLFIGGGLVFSLMFWFVFSAVLNLIAEFLGGKGTGISLFTLIGLAYLPTIFEAPVALLSGTRLENFLVFLLDVWVVVLIVLAIREAHRLSTGRAILVLATPVLVMIILVVISIGVAGIILSTLPFFRGVTPPQWFRLR